MKIMLAPNAFKEALSSVEAALCLKKGLSQSYPELETELCPVGDGGDGTLEALLFSSEGEKRTLPVVGPLGEKREAKIGLFQGGKVAYVEMAEAAGLKWVPKHVRNPLLTTTYGVGEMMLASLSWGARRVILGVGGSATVDGGIGALSALGVRFLDEFGHQVPLTGKGLLKLKKIDLSNLDPRLSRVSIEIATDVENPLLGASGAARVYGPQKGASPELIKDLEEGLENLARLLLESLGKDVSTVRGGGAAGGIAASLVAVLNARIHHGIDLFLDLVDFDQRLRGVSWTLTGEGKLDDQTLFGKGPLGVAERSKRANVPVIALAGWIEDLDRVKLEECGVAFLFPILRRPVSLDQAIKSTPDSLKWAGRELGYLFKRGKI